MNDRVLLVCMSNCPLRAKYGRQGQIKCYVSSGAVSGSDLLYGVAKEWINNLFQNIRNGNWNFLQLNLQSLKGGTPRFTKI